jgi:glycosyltransferase involved in cell wall biosynthesis
MTDRRIVMLGTSINTQGGVASVLLIYKAAGLFERQGVELIPTHADGGRWRKIIVFVQGLLRYLRLLFRGRIAAVHVHMSSRASFWRKSVFMMAAFLMRIPTILHLHGSEFAIFYEDECGRIAKCIVRFVFNQARQVVVLSKTWQRWVSGVCNNPNVCAIYNPVQLPATRTPFKTRETQTLLFLGRLGERKGSYDLLRAVARISGDFPDLKLLMGGDGEIEAVREEAQRLGIADRVELLGWVRGSYKTTLQSRASVYVLPSYNEGLPMSVLEAMAAGLPVISTFIGGIPEAVMDGVEGILVKPGDIEALAAALRRLLSDSNLRRQMGEAARLKVENVFSVDRIVPQVEALHRELLL